MFWSPFRRSFTIPRYSDASSARRTTGARISDVGRRLCLAGAALGALGLLGAVVGATSLRTVLPDLPPMMPNTGVALLLLGVAAALCRDEVTTPTQRVSWLVAASIGIAIGVGTLCEYAFDVNLGIDELLLRGQGGPYPGRPSPLTAFALASLAAALLLVDFRPRGRVRPSEWLALLAWMSGFTALVGILLGAGALYRLQRAPVIGVALPTAVSLLLLSTGLLLERPDGGIMRVATSPGPGGLLLRRLALPIVVAPALLGFLVKQVAAALGAHDLPLVIGSLAALTTVGGLLLLAIVARPLNRAQAVLDAARRRTEALIDQAEDGIFVSDVEGRHIIDVNPAGCRMLGFTREEILGKTIVDLLRPADVERLAETRTRLLAGGTEFGDWMLRRKDGTYVPTEISAKILLDGRWQAFVRDVTERRRREAQLREMQERLDLALRGADLGAWDWHVQTGEVVFDRRWAEMRGQRLAGVPRHVDAWRSGVHPDDWPRLHETLQAYFAGRLPEYEAEYRVRTASGGWIWVLDRGRVFERDAQGRPTRMVGTELDITERKRLEEQLRVAEARSSGILSISADAMISIDECQRITMFNEGAEKIFGYSRAEAIGRPLEILLPERLHTAHRAHVDRFAAGPAVAARMGARSAAIVGRRKDGEEFPADAAISKLDVGGTRILTVALRDVSEQKRIESDQRFLAEAGEVLASTLDYEDTLRNVAALAVRDFADLCVVDLVDDGVVRRLKVVARDPSKARICDVLATAVPDVRGSGLLTSVLETERPVLTRRLSPAMLTTLAPTAERLEALRALDLRSLVAVPLVAHGKLLGAIGFATAGPSRPYGPADLQLAAGLAQRAALSIENARLYQTARRATQLRDDVIGVVAHDLRNPLNSIALHAQLLQPIGDDPARRTRAVDAIRRATSRMSRLIADLLDVSRMEAGRFAVERARMPVAAVLEECVAAQRPLAASASVALRCDAVPAGVDVWADRDRLCQVFENLLGNALKFTPPGGTVAVGARHRDGEVLFWVSDTGPGIAADDLPRVFDRFWQARKGEHGGAGLGLPIVKGIVESHGGRVWAESVPGHGSTFCFTMPTASCAEPARPVPASHRDAVTRTATRSG